MNSFKIKEKCFLLQRVRHKVFVLPVLIGWKSWSSALDNNRTGSPISFTSHWPFLFFFTSLTCRNQEKKSFIPLLKLQNCQILTRFSIQKCFTAGFRDFSGFRTFYLPVLMCNKAAERKSVVSRPAGSLLWFRHLSAAARPLQCLSNDERALLQHFHPVVWAAISCWFSFPQKRRQLNQQTKAWKWGFLYIYVLWTTSQ